MNRAATTEGLAAAPARRRARLGTAPRPRRAPDATAWTDGRFAERLASVARSTPARWEWTFAAASLFVLGRSPALFVRQHIITSVPVAQIWQDDLILRSAFLAICSVAVVVAAWKCDVRSLLRQPFLLVLMGLAFVSVTWSVEPEVTIWRAGLFAGTMALGWFIGERFSPREQITLVASVVVVAAAASLAAFAVWPQFAVSTNGQAGEWSGVYGNRNLLGNAMSMGLLAAPFLWKSLDRIGRTALVLFSGVELILLVGSGSRTGPIAILAALWVSALVFAVRGIGRSTLSSTGAAIVSGGIAAVMGLLVHRNWPTIVAILGRRADLTSREQMWVVDRDLWHLHPWQGWGFESVYAHEPTVRLAKDAAGFFPFSAHNGYYEILLGIGVIGFAVFLAFLVTTVIRAYTFTWHRPDAENLWPLALVIFAVVSNFSESFFVSSEAMWALVVAAAFVVAKPGNGDVRGRRLSLSVSRSR